MDEGAPLMCPAFSDGQYRLVGALTAQGAPPCTGSGPDSSGALRFSLLLNTTHDWVLKTIHEYFDKNHRKGSLLIDDDQKSVTAQRTPSHLTGTSALEENELFSTERTTSVSKQRVRSTNPHDSAGITFIDDSVCKPYQTTNITVS